MPGISRSVCARAVSAVIALVFFASSAAAQQVFISEARAGGPGDTFQPSMSAAQMRHLGDVLELDETQAALAQEFLREYQRIYSDGARAVRERMSELQEEVQATGDFSVFRKEMGPLMEKWQADRKRFEEEMIENLRALLDEEQIERWPIFEREKRRMELLPDARLGGEDVDIALLTKEALHGAAPSQAILESLDQYAAELDAALQARKRAIDALREDWRAALGGDRDRLEKIWNEATRKREVVRDINQRYARAINEMLKESSAAPEAPADLWGMYQERAYPLAFEETRAERFAEAAEALETLDPDQRESIEAVRVDLEQQMAGLAQRLVTELVKEEQQLPQYAQAIRLEGAGSATGAFTMTIGGPDGEDAYSGLLRERWDLSQAAIQRMETLLSPEQIESIGRTEPAGDAARPVTLRGFRFNL